MDSTQEVAMRMYLKNKANVLKWQKENAQTCCLKSKKCRDKMRIERPLDFETSKVKAKENYQRKKALKLAEKMKT